MRFTVAMSSCKRQTQPSLTSGKQQIMELTQLGQTFGNILMSFLDVKYPTMI